MLTDVTDQSGQAIAAGGTAAGDDPLSRHQLRLNSVGATAGQGLQSTPAVSRPTPGDRVPAAHDYRTRTHAEGPAEMHANSRLPAEHAPANCKSFQYGYRVRVMKHYSKFTNTGSLNLFTCNRNL